MKFLMASFLMVSLTTCQSGLVVSDFCKTIDQIGEKQLLRQFTDAELAGLQLTRAQALLKLRRAYDANCTDTSN